MLAYPTMISAKIESFAFTNACAVGNSPIRRRPTSLPKVLEPIRRQFGVTYRMLDIPVPEVGLQCSGIVALVGQGEAAGMSEHVRVSLELQPCGFSGTLHHARESRRSEWRPAL